MEQVERRRVLVQRVAALFTIGPSQRRFIENLSDANTGAFELVVTPLLCALIGFAIDGALGIRPVLTVALGGLGFAGAVLRLYYDYTSRMKKASAGKPWAREEQR